MKVERRVQGTVRSADGRPVAGALVEMVPTKPTSKRWNNPYAPTFYPNTHDVKTAIPIAFLEGKDRPHVRIKGPGLYGQIETGALTVDSEGRFEIELCEGVRYSAFAFSGSPKDDSYSEPIEFTAGDSDLHFVLDKTEKEFNQLSRKLKRQ